MDKAEIEKQIKSYELCRDLVEIRLNDLNYQLDDAEKLKRRHGDFGIEGSGDKSQFICFRTHLADLHKSVEFIAYHEKNAGKHWTKFMLESEYADKLTIFGNIFDLLKEWSEDLEYFEFDVHHCEINTIEFPHAPIHIAGNWHTLAEAEEIWHKFGQMIATLKRKLQSKRDGN